MLPTPQSTWTGLLLQSIYPQAAKTPLPTMKPPSPSQPWKQHLYHFGLPICLSWVSEGCWGCQDCPPSSVSLEFFVPFLGRWILSVCFTSQCSVRSLSWMSAGAGQRRKMKFLLHAVSSLTELVEQAYHVGWWVQWTRDALNDVVLELIFVNNTEKFQSLQIFGGGGKVFLSYRWQRRLAVEIDFFFNLALLLTWGWLFMCPSSCADLGIWKPPYLQPSSVLWLVIIPLWAYLGKRRRFVLRMPQALYRPACSHDSGLTRQREGCLQTSLDVPAWLAAIP